MLLIVAGRSALALVRGTTRDGAFALALGLGASVVLALTDAGQPASSHGERCVMVELAAMTLPLAAVVLAAWRSRSVLSPLTTSAVAVSGALAGQLALRTACPDHGLDHLLVAHVGGVVAAALLGALASRIPVVPASQPRSWPSERITGRRGGGEPARIVHLATVRRDAHERDRASASAWSMQRRARPATSPTSDEPDQPRARPATSPTSREPDQ